MSRFSISNSCLKTYTALKSFMLNVLDGNLLLTGQAIPTEASKSGIPEELSGITGIDSSYDE